MKDVDEILSEVTNPKFYGKLTITLKGGVVSFVHKEEWFPFDNKSSPKVKKQHLERLSNILKDRSSHKGGTS